MNGKYNSLITAKNVGIVTILCAATATTIILLKHPTGKRSKKRKLAIASGSSSNNNNFRHLSANELISIQRDLEHRRQQILNEFEQTGHKTIPDEMDKAMDYIVNELNPSASSNITPNIRLLASQLIQDYAIMYTSIYSCEPDPKLINLAKQWLTFKVPSKNIALQIEQINHRYALALRSRSIKEFKILFEWLQSMDANLREQESIRQNWILRNFQCCCLLGKWQKVLQFGRELEKVKPEALASNGSAQQQAPLHPLHLFEYIALKLPNQSANFTQVYYNVDKYQNRYDPRLCPPLKFTEWNVQNCATQLTFAFSTNQKRNEELCAQVAKSKQTKVPSTSKFMFVYGCLVQFPCFWVQLPASNTKMQPVVLTGPWNDTEMELTASYIRRVPAYKEEAKGKKGRIRVVRSDLRLKLDRQLPYNKQQINGLNENENDEEKHENGKNNNKKSKNNGGWQWKGEFEHEEGLLECSETDLNNFEFRRNAKWKMTALKFTCRTWKCDMAISTPD